MLAGIFDALDLMLPLSTNKQSWGGDLSRFAKAVPCIPALLVYFSFAMLLTCNFISQMRINKCTKNLLPLKQCSLQPSNGTL